MKRFLIAALAAATTAGAHAAPEQPFAYTDGPNGRVLFYRKACDAVDTDEQWKYGVIQQPIGSRPGCWRQYVDPGIKRKVVEFCLSGMKDEDHKVHMGNACIVGGTDSVYKVPDRAF